MLVGDQGVDLDHVKYGGKPANLPQGMGIVASPNADLPGTRRSFLRAWDPVTQTLRWEVQQPGNSPGGTMATAGNLVFEGQINHNFVAYDATTGKKVWSYDAKAPIVAAPISYAVNGRQYITVLTGSGTGGGGVWAQGLQGFGIDFHTEPRRVLTFALGAQGVLPPAPPPIKLVAPDDPSFKPDPKLEAAGNGMYHIACAQCHGSRGMAGGTAPDLRVSPIPLNKDAFVSVVYGGALVPQGMPQFADMPAENIDAIRQYIRSLGQSLPGGKVKASALAPATMVLK
jgi:quinohemoprotein ethanol dehydrogenase